MSPVFISAMRRPPTPAHFDTPGSVDAARALLQRVGGVTSYVSDGIHSDDSDRGDSPPPLESIYDVDEEEPPPSTQPRSVEREFATIYPSLEDNSRREWTMEQFICFVYRDNAIWLRVIVVMEETGRGYDTPRVDVRFMTRFQDDDPALRRIGLIIERELQDGMRREILSAVRRAVRVRMFDVCTGQRARWIVVRRLYIGFTMYGPDRCRPDCRACNTFYCRTDPYWFL
ncbi:hypothetical protein LXA43DRAFT_1065155 [Ganoderma leucocontextum]|nr:hypothetical protein LXA43DRAFT_1065155 [Ganoderma leucocontextum]